MRDAGVRHCVLEVSSQALRRHRVDGCPLRRWPSPTYRRITSAPASTRTWPTTKPPSAACLPNTTPRAMVYNADDPASEFMRAGFAGGSFLTGWLPGPNTAPPG